MCGTADLIKVHNQGGHRPRRNLLLLFCYMVVLPNCLPNIYAYTHRSLLLLALVRDDFLPWVVVSAQVKVLRIRNCECLAVGGPSLSTSPTSKAQGTSQVTGQEASIVGWRGELRNADLGDMLWLLDMSSHINCGYINKTWPDSASQHSSTDQARASMLHPLQRTS